MTSKRKEKTSKNSSQVNKEVAMPKEAHAQQGRIDQFFAGPGSRADHWRDLQDHAQAWVNGTGSRTDFENAFAEMAALEEFHAYPGAHLLNALEDLAAATLAWQSHPA